MASTEDEQTVSRGKTEAKPLRHRSMSVTKWMEEKIRSRIEKEKCKIIDLDVVADIITKVDKLSTLCTVSLSFADKNGKVFVLSNYSSVDKDYDGSSKIGWLILAIKEFEAQAVLEFGGILLGTTQKSTYTEIPHVALEKANEVVNVSKVTTGFECYFSAELSMVKMFLSDPKYVALWTGTEIKNDEVIFENTIVKDIKTNNNMVSMKFKWIGWEMFADVMIDLRQSSSETYVTVRLQGIPIEDEGSVKAYWQQRILGGVARIFGFAIKDIKDIK